MKKVLIVLKDVDLLSALKKSHSHFPKKMPIFFAKDGKETLEIIQTEAIDLLITELDLPELDGIELIAVLALRYPTMQLAVFLAPEAIARDDYKKLRAFQSIYFILRPDSLKEFVNTLTHLDVIAHQALFVSDVIIADFFRLIEYQKKTCLITVENQLTTQKALAYFENGVVYDAIHGILKWESAISEILTWAKTLVSFKPLHEKQFRRKIFTSLEDLINSVEQPAHKDDLDLLIDNVLAKASARIKLEEAKTKNDNNSKPETATKTAEIEAIEIPAEAAEAEQSVELISNRFAQIELEKILLPLQDMTGYLACSIFDTGGNVLMQHAVSEHKMAVPAKNMVVLMKVVTQAMDKMGLGKSNFIQLNCENSIFEAMWDLDCQFAISVLLEADAKNTSLAKMKLQKACESVQNQLNEQE